MGKVESGYEAQSLALSFYHFPVFSHFEGTGWSLQSNYFLSLKSLPCLLGKSLKWHQRAPAV